MSGGSGEPLSEELERKVTNAAKVIENSLYSEIPDVLRAFAREILPREGEVCDLCALRLRGAEVIDDELRMKLVEPTGAARILAEVFGEMLDKAGAENYVEVTLFRESDNQRYVVTVHKPGGKSPHEKRTEAESALLASQSREKALSEKLTSLESVDKQLTDAREAARALAEACEAQLHTCACGMPKPSHWSELQDFAGLCGVCTLSLCALGAYREAGRGKTSGTPESTVSEQPDGETR